MTRESSRPQRRHNEYRNEGGRPPQRKKRKPTNRRSEDPRKRKRPPNQQQRRPRKPRDPREARRAAMRRKRHRANVIFFLLIVIIAIVLVRCARGAGGNKPGTSDEIGTRATSESSVTTTAKKQLFYKPTEIVRRGGSANPEETPTVPSGPAGEPSDETPTGRTYQEDFRKDIFLGDSIMDELQYYHYIYPESSVTKIGLNVETAMDHIDDVIRRQPNRVFILFGMNEANGLWETSTYINAYRALVAKLQKELPGTEIYVFSTLPVDESLAGQDPNRKNLNNETIRNYNEALQQMAIEEGLGYIDLYEIPNLTDYHEPDGVHFQSPFGDLWLQYVLEVVNQTGEDA